MPNNIAVSITADVADLTVKRAVASAELKSFQKDLNDLARTASSSGMTEALKTSMLAAADGAAKARNQVVLLNAEMKNLASTKVGDSLFAGFKNGFDSLKGSAESISAMRTSILGLGEAVAAAFAVKELADWAEKMGEAGEKVEHTAQMLGTSVGTVQQLNAAFTLMGVDADRGVQGIERLDKAFATARDGGKQQAAAFKELGVSTAQNYTQMQLLGAVMDGFAKQADGPAKAAEAMALFGRAGAALIPFLDLGSAGMAQLNDITAKYGVVSEDAVEKSAQLGESFNENKVAMSGVSNVLAQEFAPSLNVIVQGMNDLIASWISSYKQGGAVKTVLDALKSAFDVVAEAVGTFGVLIDISFKGAAGVVKGFGADWNTVKDSVVGGATQIGDQFVGLGKVMYDALTQNLANAATDMRATENQMAADALATANKIKADLAAVSAAGSSDWTSATKDANAFNQWETNLDRGAPRTAKIKPTGEGGDGDTSGDAAKGGRKKRSQGQGSEWQDELRAQELAAVQQGQTSADQLTQIEINFWASKVAEATKGSAAYKSALAQLESAEINAAKQAAAQKKQIAEGDIDTQLAIEKSSIDDRRGAVEADFKNGLITAQQKRDRLAQLLQEETQDEIDALEARKALYPQDVAAVAAADNQERVLRAKLVADIDALNRQLTADEKTENDRRVRAAKDAAEAQAKAWKTANSEILGDEKTLVDGILSGRQSLGQIVGQIALQTAEKEITADLQYWTERRLLEAEGIATSQAKEEGGLLLHVLTQRQATAASIAGQAAQTGATATGVAARTAAETTGAIQTRSIWSLTNEKQIMADAAKAASGTYSALAGIPVIGPIIAPPAAAAAYAGVMAFENLASLDVGTNYVPNDMIAQIHAGERVVPAGDNARMVSALERGAGGGDGSAGHSFKFGDTHLHGVKGDTQEFKGLLREHRDALMDNIHAAVRGGWTSRAGSPFKGS